MLSGQQGPATRARWRRILLDEIRNIVFRDSRLVPSFRVVIEARTRVLQIAYDYADDMEYDRKTLREAVNQVSAALAREGFQP